MSDSHWTRLSSTMETSLAFPSSNAGGGMSGSGLLSVMEPPHLCCSSSQTWSSHDMEEEWPISMASLKAIWWALVSGVSTFFTTLSHEGQGGVGNFWSNGLDKSQEDLSFGGLDPPLLVLWLCCPLISCLLLDLLWDLPPCLIVSDPHSSHSWVLLLGPWEGVQWSPTAIWVCQYSSHLCLLFSYWDWLSIPWKKGAQTNAMCSQTPQSGIIAPQFRCITVPRRWEGSKLQRVWLPKGSTTSAQVFHCWCPLILVSHVIAITDVLQGVSIL